jgi:hypothetical protein
LVTSFDLKEQAGLGAVGPDAEIFLLLGWRFSPSDLLGHECSNNKEAEDHGSFIAHRIGTEKTEMVREGNYISVTNEQGDEIYKVALASTTA